MCEVALSILLYIARDGASIYNYIMHLSIVCPTYPTWGRRGKGGGFVQYDLYFAPSRGQNCGVLPPSPSLWVDQGCIIMHMYTLLCAGYIIHTWGKCPTRPHPRGQASMTNTLRMPHYCPRWGRWGIRLIGALVQVYLLYRCLQCVDF